MFGLRKTLGSIILVVVFLALASLATFFYNADQAQKEQITENDLFRQGQATVGTLLGASLATSETMADANLQKNIGLGKTMADLIAKINWRGLLVGTTTESVDNTYTEPSEEGTEGATGSFWSKLGAKISAEWASNQEPTDESEIVTDSALASDTFSQSLFAYQKTDNGAEIIITPKNGNEYKVGLPFKFLTRF